MAKQRSMSRRLGGELYRYGHTAVFVGEHFDLSAAAMAYPSPDTILHRASKAHGFSSSSLFFFFLEAIKEDLLQDSSSSLMMRSHKTNWILQH